MSGLLLGMECLHCGTLHPVGPLFAGCPSCRTSSFRSTVIPAYDLGRLDADTLFAKDRDPYPGIFRWAPLLPLQHPGRAVSLGEGNTPLFPVEGLEELTGLGRIWVKDESRNPSWSHKDRMAAVAMNWAAENGVEVAVVASSGNQGAAVAAYGAATGIKTVVVTTPTIPPAMRTLIESYGAILVATATSAERWELMELGVAERNWFPVSNYVRPTVGSNPFGIEGYKSVAYEVFLQMGPDLPDWIAVPTGYGDALYGMHRGFQELHRLGCIPRIPRLLAVERFGPLGRALEDLGALGQPVGTGPTAAKSIATSVATYHGVRAVQESGGRALTVDEDAVLSAMKTLGRRGLLVEASTAAAYAGVGQAVRQGLVRPDQRVLVFSTSTLLKDLAPLAPQGEVPVIEPTLEAFDRLVQNKG